MLLFFSCCAVFLAWAEGPTAQSIDSSNPRLLRVTLASRGNSAPENLQQETSRPRSAVSTRHPTVHLTPIGNPVPGYQEFLVAPIETIVELVKKIRSPNWGMVL
jgi:hypothetical protein